MLLRCPQLPRFLIFLNVKLLKSWWTALCPSSKLHRPCSLLHLAVKVSLYNHMQKPGSEGQFLLLTVREAQPNQCPSCVLGLLGLLWRISPIPMAFVCNCMLITSGPYFQPRHLRSSRSGYPPVGWTDTSHWPHHFSLKICSSSVLFLIHGTTPHRPEHRNYFLLFSITSDIPISH